MRGIGSNKVVFLTINFFFMYHKNFIRRMHALGIPLFFCGPAFLLLPFTAAAQCTVFFSQCPEETVLIDCDASGSEELVWPQPIAATTGGCTNFVMTQTSGPALGTTVPLGTYVIEYKASAFDITTGKPSKAACKFTVTVVADTEPPVFTTCPPDITLYTGTGSSAIGLWPEPIVTDNCGGRIEVETKIPCNSELKIGVHDITYKAVDASGNIAYCHFTVTVLPGFMKPAAQEETSWQSTVGLSPGAKPRTVLPADSKSLPSDIFLMPNPFKDRLVINADQPFESDMMVQSFDLQGRMLQTQTWPAHTDQVILHAEQIIPGIILIKIVSSDGAFIKVLRGVKL
jgi:hypothetical protein